MEEKKKGMSPILIVIFTIIGICLVGFCTWYGVNYFKGENKPNNSGASEVEEDNSHNVINEPENYIENVELEAEFSKIHKFAYDYFIGETYCGEHEETAVPDIDNSNLDVYVSKQFKTYDELLNNLKKYMSIDVMAQKIGSASSDKNNYYEKDGKLYCRLNYKGWVLDYESTTVKIKSLTDNRADTRIIVKSTDEYEQYLENFDVTFEKINGNWVITKYKEIE